MSVTDASTEPARCPMRADYNPFDGDAMTAPIPTLAAAASETPVFFNPYSSWWSVAGYEEVSAVLRDTDTFSSARANGVAKVPDAARHLVPEHQIVGIPGLINSDPPEHRRIRKLANQAFTPSAVAAWGPVVEQRVTDLIDGFAADGQCEFLEAFSIPLPISVISDILGIPSEDAHRVLGWSNALLSVRMSVLDDDQLVDSWRLIDDWSEYLWEMIAQRRRASTDDLTSRLLEASDGDTPTLTDGEIRCVVTQLMLAGNETTRHLITTLTLRVAEDPELARQLIGADESLYEAVVEEEMRVRGPSRGLFRVATKDIQLGEATIKKGDTLQLCFAAANNDDRMFEQASEFKLDRDNVKRHVGFGRGEHFCIGAPLARLEARIALRQVVERLPNVRRATDDPILWNRNVIVTGMEQLDLRWDT